jgi:dipeptidase E
MPAPRRLLLLSNSRNPAGDFLAHPREAIRELLGGGGAAVLFVPFAGVTVAWDEYAALAAEPFRALGYELASVHRASSPDDAARLVREAGAIVVGGGNTFHLLRGLYATNLLPLIRDRVLGAGVPYIGWSAGSVVACPTMRTTNDMPIVEPPSLAALGLVPFQINAHYTDAHPPGFRGETRAERLREFVAANPGVPVVGLPEGTFLRVHGDDVRLLDTPTSAERAPVFGVPGVDAAPPNEKLDFLLPPFLPH